MRIVNASLYDKKIKFLEDKDLIDDNNKYTIILGENGTGKSELLRQMINNLLRIKILNLKTEYIDDGKFSYRDCLDSYLSNEYKTNLTERSINSNLTLSVWEGGDFYISYEKTNDKRTIRNFRGEEIEISDGQFRYKINLNTNGMIFVDTVKEINIISISESIHIKFPVAQDDEILSYYYPGHLKDADFNYLKTSSSGKNINEKEKSILLSMFLSSRRINKINLKSIFDLLKFEYKVKIEVNSDADLNGKLESLKNIRFNSVGINKEYNMDVFYSAINWYSSSENDEKNDIFNNSINEDKEFILDLKDNSDEIIKLYYLIEYDLINVTNIYFYRNNNSIAEIPIKDMSSGQLCIISSFSSIAARIKNGTLVFIDEPEISLHPSWASKYIELLQEKFSMFKRCHFIVATHSPHIVSNLPNDNAYVVTLKNDNVSECIKSNLFNFKSVDFQLAKIFDFPGDRNEYLIRIIMVILTKLSENKSLNKDEFKNIEELKGFLPKLKDNDPVKHLIQQISVLISNE
ncbi:hypothetical protein D3C80_700010 [compost metagenome]|nr:AAA family ATPase [Acinetobacter calcoaceticus]